MFVIQRKFTTRAISTRGYSCVSSCRSWIDLTSIEHKYILSMGTNEAGISNSTNTGDAIWDKICGAPRVQINVTIESQ